MNDESRKMIFDGTSAPARAVPSCPGRALRAGAGTPISAYSTAASSRVG